MSLVVPENKDVFASEACHAYDRDGNPQYFVPYKDKKRKGEMRPTTLRDIKENGWYPSVSTILKMIPKDGLTPWIKRQVAEAAFDITPGEMESKEEYISMLVREANDRMSTQREKGSRDHGEVERYFRMLSQPSHLIPSEVEFIYLNSAPINAVKTALDKLGMARQRVSSEKSFACPLGYGGKIDLSGYDEPWIVDFKFVSHLDKKLDYIDRCAQGAAYLFGKYGQLENCRFANIFVSTEDYIFQIKEWSQEELMHGWNVFWACFELWKILNRYDPLAKSDR